jgi:hypothetical protein
MRGKEDRIHDPEAKTETPVYEDDLAPAGPRSLEELRPAEPRLVRLQANRWSCDRGFYYLVLIRAAPRLWTDRGSPVSVRAGGSPVVRPNVLSLPFHPR